MLFYRNRLNRRGTPFYYISSILFCLYALYEVYSGTGIAGWVMDFQMEKFGSADIKISTLITFLIIYSPIIILGKLFPKLFFIQNEAAAPPKKLSWMTCTLPFLLSLVIYGGVFLNHQMDMKREVFNYTLDSQSALPENAKFIKIDGLLQRDYLVNIEETEQYRTTKKSHFLPLTSSTWAPTQPVVFVYLAEGVDVAIDPVSRQFITLDAQGAVKGIFQGELKKGKVPVYVANYFKQQGVQLAETSYLLKSKDLDPKSFEQSYYAQFYTFIPVLGLVISFGLFLGLIFQKILGKRKS